MKRYQDAEGKIPVTEAGQPVGRVEMEGVPQWDGSDMPPVGAVVEMKSPILGMWQGQYLEAEVVVVKGRTVIGWCSDKGMSIWAHHSETRPIRSAEDDAVDEMLTVTDEHLSPEDTCRALYRAGYRKQ